MPNKEYKPLPQCLTIKSSDIHGLGVFAEKEVLSGITLGVSHINVAGEIFRTPLGGFINHSSNPNCKKYEVDNKFFLKTIRNIEKDEELTVFYTLYRINEQKNVK